MSHGSGLVSSKTPNKCTFVDQRQQQSIHICYWKPGHPGNVKRMLLAKQNQTAPSEQKIHLNLKKLDTQSGLQDQINTCEILKCMFPFGFVFMSTLISNGSED